MIKAVTGTKDTLPADIHKWYQLEETVRTIFASLNYKEIRTPVFEETALFARGIGEATDIVSKEMYTFEDRGGDSLTLKPEMTAAVVRAFIEHSLGVQQPLHKLFYISPMFRQERPQAGRFRQFHQYGAEALGGDSPLLDAEMIKAAYDILKALGLKDLELVINSLGTPESRVAYRKELRKYLSDKVEKLSNESKQRMETNILRIFDSKDEGDQKIMKDAPLLPEFLDDDSRDHFEQVKNLLTEAGVPFTVDPKLVRGLDYYTKTTFEILSGSVGSQSALCGGGRYDGLVEQLGGKPAPGVGFAAGMERILLALENEGTEVGAPQPLNYYIIRIDKDITNSVFSLATQLRDAGYNVDLDYLQRSVKAQMREANRLNAEFVIFMGGEELEQRKVSVKHMGSGSQQEFTLDNLIAELKHFRVEDAVKKTEEGTQST